LNETLRVVKDGLENIRKASIDADLPVEVEDVEAQNRTLGEIVDDALRRGRGEQRS
jgi:hypothetical protein